MTDKKMSFEDLMATDAYQDSIAFEEPAMTDKTLDERISERARRVLLENWQSDEDVLRSVESAMREAIKIALTMNPNSEPVLYCLMNSEGKMYWDEEECVWGSSGDCDGLLEAIQTDEPDDGWHEVPLYDYRAMNEARLKELEKS